MLFCKNPQFCSNSDYRKFALYLISRHYHKSQASNIDLVDAVVSRMMLADATYDESFGASRKTHRYNQGRFAIQVFCKKHSTKKRSCQRERLYSKESQDSVSNLSDADTPLSIAINNETRNKIHHIIENSCLSDRDKDIVYMRLEGSAFPAIASKYGVTKERVRQKYIESLTKMRMVAEKIGLE